MKKVVQILNRNRIVILWMFTFAMLAVCFRLPDLILRIQERKMEQELEKEVVQAVDISMYTNNGGVFMNKGISVEEKIDIINSNEVMNIYLDNGENYTPDEVKDKVEDELWQVMVKYGDSNDLLNNLREVMETQEIFNSSQVLAQDVIEKDAYEEQKEVIINTYSNMEVIPVMYVNPEQQTETFIAWNIFYSGQDYYIELEMDDETGELLKIAMDYYDSWGMETKDFYDKQEEMKEVLKTYYRSKA